MDVFQKMVNSYNGIFNWSKEGIVDFVNFSLAQYAINNGSVVPHLYLYVDF